LLSALVSLFPFKFACVLFGRASLLFLWIECPVHKMDGTQSSSGSRSCNGEVTFLFQVGLVRDSVTVDASLLTLKTLKDEACKFICKKVLCLVFYSFQYFRITRFPPFLVTLVSCITKGCYLFVSLGWLVS